MICLIWNETVPSGTINYGNLGSIRNKDYNKTYIFAKFKSDSKIAIPAVNVECEEPVSISSTQRMYWYREINPYRYNGANSISINVDGGTLVTSDPESLVTPSVTPTTPPGAPCR
jgi:hypothetical protein